MGVDIFTNTNRHDFNDELGDGKLFEGWDRIENKWERYAHEVFGVQEDAGEHSEDGDEDPVPRRKPGRGKWHPWINLPSNEDGTPSIPVILNMNAQDKKDVVQAFIGFHYGNVNKIWKLKTNGVTQERLLTVEMLLFPGMPLQ